MAKNTTQEQPRTGSHGIAATLFASGYGCILLGLCFGAGSRRAELELYFGVVASAFVLYCCHRYLRRRVELFWTRLYLVLFVALFAFGLVQGLTTPLSPQ